ncbi:MAG: hypothetical protein ACI31A_05410, partial [Candidatus Limisoma sp.]
IPNITETGGWSVSVFYAVTDKNRLINTPLTKEPAKSHEAAKKYLSKKHSSSIIFTTFAKITSQRW